MDIKNIIKEEFRGLLNEGYVFEHDNFKFRQENVKSSFYNFQAFSTDYDVDIHESEIGINWRIGFWLTDQGIENFIVKADSVEGTYHVELLNRQTDEVEQEDDKNIAAEPWKFQIFDANLKLKDSLYIESLDFDFKTKICTVNFYDSDAPLNEGVRPKLNEGREELLDYYKTMWSQSDGVKKLIFSNSYMTDKYAKYVDPAFDWDTLSDEELQRIWSEWAVDEDALNNQSRL